MEKGSIIIFPRVFMELSIIVIYYIVCNQFNAQTNNEKELYTKGLHFA